MRVKVNFIEKGAFVLTYKKMVVVIMAWIFLCIGVFFIEGTYNWFLGRSKASQEVVLRKLNIRKERTMALVEASKTDRVSPDVKELSDIFTNYPVWSNVMAELSGSLPSQSWLTSISSEYLSGDSMVRRIEIGGMARNASTIASFVRLLSEKPLFSRIVLNKSNRVEEESKKKGYSFVVLGEVKFGEKKWR